ncbi:MAG: MotA/TolQ/ExbB proton channel family protein [Chitinivibrionales bacterium]|nr:MotA/TolQ/ExbB proton channel family protein [Chitinivibrionales bacterium]
MPTNSLIQIMQDGGLIFMIPLLLLSILSGAIIIERFFTYWKKIVLPSSRRELIKATVQKKDISAISSLLADDQTLTATILRESFEAYTRKTGGTALPKEIESIANHHIESLVDNLWILRAIGQVAPVIGLLGTVVGLAISFKQIAQSGISQQSVAGGISMALITTIAGLFIALPTLCAEYCLRAWAHQLLKKIRHFLTMTVEWYEV